MIEAVGEGISKKLCVLSMLVFAWAEQGIWKTQEKMLSTIPFPCPTPDPPNSTHFFGSRFMGRFPVVLFILVIRMEMGEWETEQGAMR